jgi:hypothetical protein
LAEGGIAQLVAAQKAALAMPAAPAV